MRHVNFEVRVLCFAAIAAFLFYYQNHVSNDQLGVIARASEKTTAAASVYTDGTYKSSAQGYDGPVKVEVTVENGLIAAVEVTSAEGEDPAFLADAKAIIGYMIEAQSTEVDSISGATLTAEGIRRATEKALKKAVPEE